MLVWKINLGPINFRSFSYIVGMIILTTRFCKKRLYRIPSFGATKQNQ